MSEVFLVINIFFTLLSLYWAKESFDRGQSGLGYMNIFISAMNAAAVLVKIF